MKVTFQNIIQVAGVRDPEEARMLMDHDVDLLGFPLRLPVHKEDLSDAEAAKVISRIHPPHYAVLITYLGTAAEIIALSRLLHVSIVQLHGVISIEELRQLRARMPELSLIKSLIVGKESLHVLLDQLIEVSPLVDAFITDSYDPQSGASGATGRVHDWSVSAALVENSSKPIILAGGLTPDNVVEAIRSVRPAGVDIHTGVEDAAGRKDPELLQRFVERARQAFATNPGPAPKVEISSEIPIDGVLDLHTFSPREVKDLVPDYLLACRARGISQIRIIHGKGTGSLRRMVHSLLDRLDYVESYHTPEMAGGGWGATVLRLKGRDETIGDASERIA